MCTFNGMPYLKEQLQTVVMQTYPSIEVIIQDDGSTDGTLDTIKTFQKKYSFIKLYHNDGEHGVNGNFFSAMFRATGDYIAICDQDDIWELNKIEKMMHSRHASSNVKNEWFDMTVTEVLNFKNECAKCEKILDSIQENPFI